MTIIRHGLRSDKGRVRDNNEDAVFAEGRVFAVADGMGGAEFGEVASATAVAVVSAWRERIEHAAERVEEGNAQTRMALSQILERMFEEANSQVRQAAVDRDVAAMGTTLVVAVQAASLLFVAHVGDSRAYVLREGELAQITADHSVAALRVQRGLITEEQAESDPTRHRLYQVIGQPGPPDVDVLELSLADGDRVLLCSDGLYEPLGDERLVKGLEASDPDRAAARLVSAANRAGGPDNISLIILHIEGGDDATTINRRGQVLRSLFLFERLTHQERLEVAPYLSSVLVDAGEVMVSQGDPADTFWMIVEGVARVEAGDVHLTDLGPGAHFGEFALLPGSSRTASVVAATPMILLTLARRDFEALIRNRPDIGARVTLGLLGSVTGRLKDLTQRIQAAQRALSG
ncbi:MAG: serine/threonine protein phosphatase PrpC [Myxococcota bacterium]|jgi:serine/threonine protein phosphatase PrpC